MFDWIHTRNKALAPDVSLDDLADRTAGFSGAQLEALANEAAMLAVRRARASEGASPAVGADDFLRALMATAGQTRLFNQVDAVRIASSSTPTPLAKMRKTPLS